MHRKFYLITFLAAVLLFSVNVSLNGQNIRINEFMASNSITVADEDGDYEDWIELHNLDGATINLAGFGLSDNAGDLHKWTFPKVVLVPGGYLRVWASGKNKTTVGAPLHTSFKIDTGGEEIFLTSPMGVTVDQIGPVSVPTDVSYGRKPDGNGDWFYFDTPTPGLSNTATGYSVITQAPEFSVPGELYTEIFHLELTAEPGAVIYYTTNGNLPTQTNSILYSSPIQMSGTAIIRARAFKAGQMPSETKTMTYTRIGSQLDGFKTNLPVIILHQFNTTITPGARTPAVAVFIENNQGDSTYLPGAIALQSRVLANVRGRSSQMFPKKMFGFHLVDERNGSRNESLLGLPEDHNWILNGPYSDKTLMRNVLAYGTGNKMGRYSPRTQFVEVFLHSGNGALTNSHYHGVYVLVERIKRSESRVNLTKIHQGDDSEPEITGGYIIKRDWMDDGEIGFTTSYNTELAFVRPSEEYVTPAQKLWIKNYINSFEAALFGPNFTDPEFGYKKFIDVESFLDHFLITELFKEIDGYRLSTYMFKERNGKLVMGPLWDFNLSLGNANYLQGWVPQGWYYPSVSDHACGNWFSRMMQDPAFQARWKHRWWELRQDIFSKLNLSTEIYQNKALLAEAQVRNFQRWPTLGQWVWPNWYIGQTYDDEVNWMNNFLMSRIDWIDSQAGTPPVFPQTELIFYWFLNATLPNDYPLESIEASYKFMAGGQLIFQSALSGYPFTPEDPNWRKAAMERRNEPTPLNYRPEGNTNIPFEESDMRGIQVKQPFTGDGGGNTLIFDLPTNGFSDVVFRFAAVNHEAASYLMIDYSIDSGTPVWKTIGLDQSTVSLLGSYKLFALKFNEVNASDNNPDFKIRIRFGGNNMSFDFGNQVVFNNFSLDGVFINPGNMPPVVNQPIQLQQVIESGQNHVVDLSEVFSDPDNDPMTFAATSNRPEIVQVQVTGQLLTIIPLKRGDANISITATDGNYTPVSSNFRVLVYPQAFPMRNGAFTFTAWNANEPDYAYPEYMIFLQSEINDPALNEPLLWPYFIPHDDYHEDDMATIGFPYNNTRRTRINGLGNAGISFINTGQGRDLGGALLAIDTRNISDATLDWLGGTILRNERLYGLRLQYRTSLDSSFTDLINEGGIVEYMAGQNGDVFVLENIHLPDEVFNQEYVQLLWRYYHVSGNFGARSQLRLDDIIFKDIVKVNNPLEHLISFNAADGSVFVSFGKPLKGKLSVFDITGRMVASKSLNGDLNSEINLNFAIGVFLVQIVTDEIIWSEKVFIK